MESSSQKPSAFMTSNGLKVRLNHDFCVQYLEESNISSWYISIEGFDSLRGILSIISVIVMMLTHESPIFAGVTIAALYLFGYYVSQSFFMMALLNLVYGLFYMIYSFLSKFFVQYIAIVVIAIITHEYWLVLSFVAARAVCFIILNILNVIKSKYTFSRYGVYIGDVEITAIRMLQFYSSKNIKCKQWLKEYSTFMKTEETVTV